MGCRCFLKMPMKHSNSGHCYHTDRYKMTHEHEDLPCVYFIRKIKIDPKAWPDFYSLVLYPRCNCGLVNSKERLAGRLYGKQDTMAAYIKDLSKKSKTCDKQSLGQVIGTVGL